MLSIKEIGVFSVQRLKNLHACCANGPAESCIGGRERQSEAQGERKIGGVIVRKAMVLCEGGQLKNFSGGLRDGLNGEVFQPRQESINLILGNPLPPMGHEKAIADFVEPYEGNYSPLLGKTCEDAKAVFAVGFIL